MLPPPHAPVMASLSTYKLVGHVCFASAVHSRQDIFLGIPMCIFSLSGQNTSTVVEPAAVPHLIQENTGMLRVVLLARVSTALGRATPFPGPSSVPPQSNYQLTCSVTPWVRPAHHGAPFHPNGPLGGSRGPRALLRATPGAGARYPHAFHGSTTLQTSGRGGAACAATVFVLGVPWLCRLK